MREEKKLTGYPSIDKPWLKYYSEEEIHAPLPEMTMYQYIWENNKDHLSDIALRYYGTKITYGKLFENIKRAANALYAMGIRAGDIVTIMSMHTPETIYAIYGLNYIGAVANIVYMSLTEEEILNKIKQTQSKALFILDLALQEKENLFRKLNIPIITISVFDSMPFYLRAAYHKVRKASANNVLNYQSFLNNVCSALPAGESNSKAIIVYTSGSTGTPKGVVLTNKALNAHSTQERIEMYGLKRGLKFLLILPPFIGFGITKLNVALNAGIDIELWIDLHPEKIVNAFFVKKPEIFVAGPALIDYFIQQKPKKIKQLKLFIGGGGALSEDKEMAFNQFLSSCQTRCVYANGYGMTEGGSTLCGSSNKINKIGSAGIPLPKTNVKVIEHDSGKMLLYGEIGELCFSTPDMMLEYYKDKTATNEVLYRDEEGMLWLHTGDLGFVDSDGFVFIKGRIKRIYITRGKDGMAYKLFPQHIEEFFESDPTVRQCATIVKELETSVFAPIAFITLEDPVTKGAKEEMLLREKSLRGLSSHEQPLSIHILDTMPMTPSGKIDYRALEEMAKGM